MLKQLILAFFGSVFPVILFNIDRKKILLAGTCGALGWIVYCIVFYFYKSAVASSFAGAFAVGLFSEIMARIVKTPATMFSIPGMFPLVPGFYGYDTVRNMVEGNMTEAMNRGILTIGVGGAIAFGIMISIALVKFLGQIMNNRRTA